jgi:transcriptional regulator with XRE-family HTH domain
MDDVVQAVTTSIGARLRGARTAARRTLGEVAAAAGLSEGFLSRLERGQASCSIANLIQLATVLDLSLADLFAERAVAARTRATVHRAGGDGDFDLVDSTGYRFRHLAGGAARDEIEVFHLIFPRDHGMQTVVAHPGQEHCYVLAGEIEFEVAGAVHRLAAGDGILIDSSQPHLARNVGAGQAQVLMTVTRIPATSAAPEWWRIGPAGNHKEETA